ncbi:cbb3-type cytochrome oxidase assembly protein CcoS [Halomonas sp. PR-M31]|uniref:cbb3-type cytochrome oxidase assembly protein CcoS n=1 Tax=Halomonas sp. PR-M31 TaxID=1471202 RepID=UPI0006525984|nr:cbb3-type cytochrome oxidase assembly protein CcoS [Halomonas sp. PR-M31]
MSILYLLIPISLLLLSLAVWAFFWAVKHDQFDDLEGPAYRILFDEDENDLTAEQRQRKRAHRKPRIDDDTPASEEHHSGDPDKNPH